MSVLETSFAALLDEAVYEPRAVPAASLAPLDAGAQLDMALARLAPLADQSDADLLEIAAAHERVASAAKARQAAALAELARRRTASYLDPASGLPDEDAEFVEDEVAFRMRWGRVAARNRVAEAERLAQCLPRTMDHLAAGRLDYPRAAAIVRGTDELDPEDAAAVDAAIAPDVAGLTVGEIRARIALEVAAVDAHAASKRHERGRQQRAVLPRPLPDGLAELVVTGPAPQVWTIAEAVDQLAAEREPGDQRGVDARRFDALVALAEQALGQGASSERRPRPQVLVTMALPTLLGLDESPCQLARYGPLPAEVARAVARRGVLRRMFTDPATGALVGVDGHTYDAKDIDWPDADAGNAGGEPDPGGGGGGGPNRSPQPRGDPHSTGPGRYRPGAALDRLVRARYQRCTAPGCRMPAWRCDLDHLVRHPEGPTCSCNMHPLCRHHHRMKHQTWTSVQMLPDGGVQWTTPMGNVYQRHVPAPLPRPTVAASARPHDDDVPDPPGCHDIAAWGYRALRAAAADLGGSPSAPERPRSSHAWPHGAGDPPF